MTPKTVSNGWSKFFLLPRIRFCSARVSDFFAPTYQILMRGRYIKHHKIFLRKKINSQFEMNDIILYRLLTLRRQRQLHISTMALERIRESIRTRNTINTSALSWKQPIGLVASNSVKRISISFALQLKVPFRPY